MSVHWLQPLAWWGLGLLVLPIVIHLLARHRSRRLRFPSLKFVPVAQMAALRRRVLTNWPLLVVRLLILAAAVAASASPVWISDARRQSWDQRVARAVVLASPPTDETRSIAADEARTSFAGAEFSADTVPDALREAGRWLAAQPPAAREIVVVGDLREGALAEADLASIPPYTGLRFLPVVPSDGARAIEWWTVGESADGRVTSRRIEVTPEVARTDVDYGDESDSVPASITVAAAADDQPYADALLRAVLRDGLVLGADGDRAVTFAFEGAALAGHDRLATPTRPWMRATLEQTPDVRGGELDGALVVTPDVPVTDARAPRIVADVLRTAFAGPRVELESRRIAADRLAAWSRPYGTSPADARPADEGDRRWFWAAALILLALEHVIRRRPRAA
jgi:hypothetical protein